MKTLVKLPIAMMYLIVLVSCTTDSPGEPPVIPQAPDTPHNNPIENNDDYSADLYFGFLDGSSSSNTFIDMPIESSPTSLIVGRWKIIKIGIDENNNGNIKFYNYVDYEHQDCGESFLQFNNDGVAFENNYYKNESTCTLYAEIDNYEFIGANRLKVHVYNNIFLVDVTQSELILKYDWDFENSLYGPMQVFYYYERIPPAL